MRLAEPDSASADIHAPARMEVCVHQQARLSVPRVPSLRVGDCNILTLSESGCRVALQDMSADQFQLREILDLHTSFPPGLTFRATLASEPETVPEWGVILKLNFLRLDEGTYRQLISFLRNLSKEERARCERQDHVRRQRRLSRKLRRALLLSSAAVAGTALCLLTLQGIRWMHTEGYRQAAQAVSTIHAIGEAVSLTPQERLLVMKSRLSDETGGSLSPDRDTAERARDSALSEGLEGAVESDSARRNRLRGVSMVRNGELSDLSGLMSSGTNPWAEKKPDSADDRESAEDPSLLDGIGDAVGMALPSASEIDQIRNSFTHDQKVRIKEILTSEQQDKIRKWNPTP